MLFTVDFFKDRWVGRVLGTCSKLDETKREKIKLINELCTRTVNNFNQKT